MTVFRDIILSRAVRPPILIFIPVKKLGILTGQSKYFEEFLTLALSVVNVIEVPQELEGDRLMWDSRLLQLRVGLNHILFLRSQLEANIINSTMTTEEIITHYQTIVDWIIRFNEIMQFISVLGNVRM